MAQHFIPNPENKEQVNHKNFDTLDNRLENLEWATQEENTQYRKKFAFSRLKKQTKNRYKVVCYRSWFKKFEVYINKDKVRHIVGYFVNERDAALAYNEAAKKYHGNFAYLNEVH